MPDERAAFRVTPSRSPESESVYAWVRVKGVEANLLFTRDEAFDLAQQLQHAAEWLKKEENGDGADG